MSTKKDHTSKNGDDSKKDEDRALLIENKKKANDEKQLNPKDIDQTEKSLFFSVFEKDRVIINKAEAGAGFTGLVGFGGLFFIATIFFITENYFISMFTISIGLLVYVTGLNVLKLLMSSFTIFFSSKHLNVHAASLQETLLNLKKILRMKRDKEGNIVAEPICPETPI